VEVWGVAKVAVGGCLAVRGWQQVADMVAGSNNQKRQRKREKGS